MIRGAGYCDDHPEGNGKSRVEIPLDQKGLYFYAISCYDGWRKSKVKRGESLGKFDTLDELVFQGNGYLKTSKALQNGISKTTLAEYVKDRNLERAAHGVYASEDAWPDPFYLLSLKNGRIVFSQESALYLHGLMEREPACLTVTVPKGYNDTHLKKQGVRVIHSKEDWFPIGVSQVETNYGNTVPVYDMERTICDIIRNKKDMEIQTFQTAMKEYMGSRRKNLGHLMKYAKEFHIDSAVRTYTEVML